MNHVEWKLFMTDFVNLFQISKLLKTLGSTIVKGKIVIVDLPDVTQVKFTLKGKEKINAAYQLEEKVTFNKEWILEAWGR